MQKSIIFDCDGVLVDSEVIYRAIELKHLAQIGLAYSDSEYEERFIGITFEDYIEQLSADYYQKYSKSFPENYAVSVSNECAITFETDLKEIQGATDFINRLDRPSAVASSSSLESLNKKLDVTGLNKYFGPHIYSGEQVEHGKPSPDIFLHTAKELSVLPGNCIVIEDSINGVTAGVSANMEVWGFVGGGHTNSDTAARLINAGATNVFTSYASIVEYMFG